MLSKIKRRAFGADGRKGFSLSEALVTLLILGLMALVTTVGENAAISSYKKISDSANAEMLLSNTLTLMRQELNASVGIVSSGTDTDSGKMIVAQYLVGETGTPRKLAGSKSAAGVTDANEPEGVYLVQYEGISTTTPVSATLITNEGAARNLSATFSSITYDDASNTFTVNNLKVTNSAGNTLIAEKNYSIPAFNQIEVRDASAIS